MRRRRGRRGRGGEEERGEEEEERKERRNDDDEIDIYVADLSGQGISEITGLQLNGNRCTRARFPNANPETDVSSFISISSFLQKK
jgi:hypothetical protein